MQYTSDDVAVVIPAYNCADTIENALETALSQSPKVGEVVVVNDGSTDITDEVIRKSKFFSQITYISSKNGGPAAARNKGLQATTKAWVAFLDADDLWLEQDKCAKQIALANQHTDATLIDGFAEIVWPHTTITQTRSKQGQVLASFLYENAVNATSSVMVKTEVAKSVGGFREDIRFGEDRLLWAQMAKHGGVYTLERCVVRKINEDGNLTSIGGKNYKYRSILVEALLELIPLDEKSQNNVRYHNQKDFMRVAMKANNANEFLSLYNQCKEYIGYKMYFTRYFMIKVYGEIFNNYNLFIKGK